jgi:hypothetical protein
MKTMLRKTVLVSLLCSLPGFLAWAQNVQPDLPATPAAPAAPVLPAPPTPQPAKVPRPALPPAVVPSPPVAVNTGMGMGGMGGMGGGGGYAGGGYVGYGGGYGGTMSIGPFPSRMGQFLVVPGAGTDDKRIATIDEDLAIMSHLLERATGDKMQDVLLGSAMNVPLHTMGPQRMVRGMYLEGYGAVFMLNVRFALTPSPSETEKPKTATNSNWERSKQEVFGAPDRDVLIQADDPFGGPAEGYDKKKVDDLQRRLLECLKEAVNIRELKPEEMVVVAVIGARNAPRGHTLIAHAAGGRSTGVVLSSDSKAVAHAREESVMTIRVSKSDAEAFNKGDLTFDQFRQKAVITIH